MDYTEQFIRLNCSLMSDYKHDFNELDLLADQWGATVENLQHLIKDFDLFLITEDGYFRCLYLDEVMGYQSKLSEQRAAAGSKGGRSSKKSTVKASAKATASTIGRGRINEGKNGDTSCMDRNEEIYTKSDDTPCMDNNKEVYLKSSGAPSMDSKERIYMESRNVDSNKTVCMESSKPIHSDYNKEIYKENSTESNVKSSAESMKNTTAKNTNENSVKNVIQSVDNECYGKNLQASFKQSFIREEKNRGEKKNNNNKEKEIIAVAAVDKLSRFSELSETMPRWEQCINEAFITQSWLEAVGMMSGLKELFLNNLSFIRDLFKKHVVAQGNTGGITSVSEAEAYFANYIRRERPTRLFLEEKLKERSRMQNESTSLSPYADRRTFVLRSSSSCRCTPAPQRTCHLG